MKLNVVKLRRKASSVVIALLVVTLLAIIMVAFMQTSMMARTSAKSFGDIKEATFAAEAGLEIAISQLVLAAGTNQAFVTGLVNAPDSNWPLTVIGQRDLTNKYQLMPLVSGPTNLLVGFGVDGWQSSFEAYNAARTNVDPAKAIDVNTSRKYIQATNSTSAYRAAWVTLTNAIDGITNYTRFAYVIVDEQGKLNPALHDGTGSAQTNATNWYGGAYDIALTNAGAQRLTSAQANLIRSSSNSFFQSTPTLGQAFPDRSAYEAVKHLFTAQTNPTFDVIPQWLPEGGKPKYNINDLATNSTFGATPEARALQIASVISRNLTNFYQRDPALRGTNSETYLNRIAANIVDYIDSDGSFTRVAGDDSGMEKTVFPTTISERIQCVEGGAGTPAHSRAIIDSQFFVSVWNPYTQPIEVRDAQLRIWNRPTYTFGNAPVMQPPEYNVTINPGLTIRPNEFGVLAFDVQRLPTMNLASGATTNGPVGAEANNQKYVQYELRVNGEIVAKSQGVDASGLAIGGGLDHDKTLISGVNFLVGTNNAWINAQIDQHGTIVSDPRFASMYQTVWYGTIEPTYYTDSTYWKGRRGVGANSHAYQDFSLMWRKRDNVPRNGTVGSKPGSVATLPSSLVSTYKDADASAAPGVIRDGPMASIGELGHIFDPVHADNDLSTTNGKSGKFEYESVYQNGGARTLRIGQPEFQASGANNWNTNGRRSLELLDLFTVNSTNLVTGGVVGRINPNTAPRDVLATLFAGIRLSGDQEMSGGARIIASPENLAAFMISNRPYSSLSDLQKFTPALLSRTNFSPQMPVYLDGTAQVVNAADRVKEEAFGKIVQHLTVQSRTYKVYVIGQVLDRSMNPRGSVVLEASIFLKSQPGGRFKPLVQYTRLLR